MFEQPRDSSIVSFRHTDRKLCPVGTERWHPRVRQNHRHPSHSHGLKQTDTRWTQASRTKNELARFGHFGIATVVVEPLPAIHLAIKDAIEVFSRVLEKTSRMI